MMQLKKIETTSRAKQNVYAQLKALMQELAK
jgi:hypothetical protein